jgi:2-keto-4-pentenoate hydratase/2-oxohepta-3-ene-1,7-dioic acid hydratase in catechol pathway
VKLVTFRHTGSVRAGILQGDASGPEDLIFDLQHPAMRPALGGLEPQVQLLLEAGLERVTADILAHGLHADAALPLRQVFLLAPVPRPKRIFGIAHNYRDALAERGMALPAEPILFMKEGATVIGPGEAIVLPEGIGGCTYEAELAVVIGRRADSVSAADALSHVAAYGIFNDVSASEMIRRDGAFTRGKNVPSFGPFGPYIVTADEIADPQALRLGLTVDGKALQDGTTSQMLFGVAELVSFLSHQTPLEPGDIIATGTPAGVAPVQNPPTWLRPGTTLCAWVEGLGTLTNPVIEGPAFHG